MDKNRAYTIPGTHSSTKDNRNGDNMRNKLPSRHVHKLFLNKKTSFLSDRRTRESGSLLGGFLLPPRAIHPRTQENTFADVKNRLLSKHKKEKKLAHSPPIVSLMTLGGFSAHVFDNHRRPSFHRGMWDLLRTHCVRSASETLIEISNCSFRVDEIRFNDRFPLCSITSCAARRFLHPLTSNALILGGYKTL